MLIPELMMGRDRGWGWLWYGLRVAACGGLTLLGFGSVSCSSSDPAPSNPSCTDGSNCGAQQLCIDKVCESICLNDSQCSGERTRCDPVLHICVGCIDDSECSTAEYCDKICKPDVCEPGSKSCDPVTRARRACEDNGGGYRNTACGSRTSCVLDAGETSCQNWICTAKQASCDAANQKATVCADDGLSQVTTDCAADGRYCLKGACVETQCNPGRAFCKDGDSYECADDGQSSALHQGRKCLESEFCDTKNGICAGDRCKANQGVCDGTRATTCLPDGGGYVSGGTDCATIAGTRCAAGKCSPALCEPNQQYCDAVENAIMDCDSTGTVGYVDFHCPTGHYCDPVSLNCPIFACQPNGPTCSGEKLATCKADGSGAASTSIDCAASGKLCSLSGSCVTEDVSIVAPTTYATDIAVYTALNAYKITNARTLTRVEHKAKTSVGNELTWLVYEGSEQSGLARILQKVTAATGAEFESSGDVQIPLLPNKYYVIGVRAEGNTTLYRDYELELPSPLSFGQCVGSRNNSLGAMEEVLDGFSREFPFYQRLTTTQ
jgi:hypothetical protein